MTWLIIIFAASFVVQIVATVVMLKVSSEVAGRLKSPGGPSLHDVANLLEDATRESKAAAGALKVDVEKVRELAAEDRAELHRLLLMALQTSVAVGRGTAATKRVEDQQQGFSAELAAAQKRADEVEAGEAGSAADAAAKTE